MAISSILEGSDFTASDKPNHSGGTIMTPPTVEYRTIPLTNGQMAYVSSDRYEEIRLFWMKRRNNGTSVGNGSSGRTRSA
jgi:hypothetical protein